MRKYLTVSKPAPNKKSSTEAANSAKIPPAKNSSVKGSPNSKQPPPTDSEEEEP
jgi:hypothetical protein